MEISTCASPAARELPVHAQTLTDMVELSGAEMPLWLAVRIEGALAMLAYARAELLWWFRHWKEVTHLATMHGLSYTCNASGSTISKQQERFEGYIAALAVIMGALNAC